MGIIAKTPVGQFYRWYVAYSVLWVGLAAFYIMLDDQQGITNFTPYDWAKVTLASASVLYFDAALS